MLLKTDSGYFFDQLFQIILKYLQYVYVVYTVLPFKNIGPPIILLTL